MKQVYTRNSNFFSEPNILNSYWAGFIAADGCISTVNLLIDIHLRDIEHLEQLKTDLNYTGNVTVSKRNSAKLQVRDKKIVEDLKKNFNITERKTHTLQPPMIEEIDYIKAFIIGYIDGDGCIGYYKPRSKTEPKKPYLVITSNIFICAWISNIISEHTNIQGKIYQEDNIFRLRYTCSNADKVLKWLAEDQYRFLERKWDGYNNR
jgi:hypothetical protein